MPPVPKPSCRRPHVPAISAVWRSSAPRRQPPREVAVTVEKSHCDHRNVLVRRLLEVVAGKDAEASGVYLQRVVQTVLHREVCYLLGLRVRFLVHVVLELRVYPVEYSEEHRIVLKLHQTVHRKPVEQYDRVPVDLYPKLLVDVLEQVAGARSPAPPEVARKLLERVQALRQGLLDHDALPCRTLGDKLLAHEVYLLVR